MTNIEFLILRRIPKILSHDFAPVLSRYNTVYPSHEALRMPPASVSWTE